MKLDTIKNHGLVPKSGSGSGPEKDMCNQTLDGGNRLRQGYSYRLCKNCAFGSLSVTCTHTHTRTLAHAHAHARTRARTRTHTRTHARTRTRTHAHARTRTHTHTHAHTHTVLSSRAFVKRWDWTDAGSRYTQTHPN